MVYEQCKIFYDMLPDRAFPLYSCPLGVSDKKERLREVEMATWPFPKDCVTANFFICPLFKFIYSISFK